MNWSSVAVALGRLLPVIQGADEAALKVDPALKQSVTLEMIVQGVKTAEAFPWVDISSALESHFSDPTKTVSTIEEVLAALAPFIPGVVPFEEAAQVIALLCKLNVIQAQHGANGPIFGADSPQYRHAPFI